MRLADRIAQSRTPFVVRSTSDNTLTQLNGAADFATDIAQVPLRYVLSDDLTRLCTALAYSKGARSLECADVLRVPMQRVWIEWCDAAWLAELELYGFKTSGARAASGRRGALIQASADGRCGLIRTFWSTGGADLNLLASSMEAYFDLDTEDGEEPWVPDGQEGASIRVCDMVNRGADILPAPACRGGRPRSNG
jgi:hypothetical protein